MVVRPKPCKSRSPPGSHNLPRPAGMRGVGFMDSCVRAPPGTSLASHTEDRRARRLGDRRPSWGAQRGLRHVDNAATRSRNPPCRRCRSPKECAGLAVTDEVERAETSSAPGSGAFAQERSPSPADSRARAEAVGEVHPQRPIKVIGGPRPASGHAPTVRPLPRCRGLMQRTLPLPARRTAPAPGVGGSLMASSGRRARTRVAPRAAPLNERLPPSRLRSKLPPRRSSPPTSALTTGRGRSRRRGGSAARTPRG